MAKFCTVDEARAGEQQGQQEQGNPESKESQRTNVYGSDSNSDSNCDSNSVAIAITHMDTQNICESKQRELFVMHDWQIPCVS